MPKGRTFRRIADVPSDGSCFYHSMHWALRDMDREAPPTPTIRRMVAQHLRKKGSRAQTEAYARAASNEWAQAEEVAAAADVFRVQIRVWEGVNKMWVTFGSNERAPTVYMHNPHNVHFDPIAPCVPP